MFNSETGVNIWLECKIILWGGDNSVKRYVISKKVDHAASRDAISNFFEVDNEPVGGQEQNLGGLRIVFWV